MDRSLAAIDCPNPYPNHFQVARTTTAQCCSLFVSSAASERRKVVNSAGLHTTLSGVAEILVDPCALLHRQGVCKRGGAWPAADFRNIPSEDEYYGNLP